MGSLLSLRYFSKASRSGSTPVWRRRRSATSWRSASKSCASASRNIPWRKSRKAWSTFTKRSRNTCATRRTFCRSAAESGTRLESQIKWTLNLSLTSSKSISGAVRIGSIIIQFCTSASRACDLVQRYWSCNSKLLFVRSYTRDRLNSSAPCVAAHIFSVFHSQEWSISNFPCSLTRNITSHSLENLVVFL